MRVDLRPTPAERAGGRTEIEVEEALIVLAATLRCEERDGIAKLAPLDTNSLHIELFHTLTFT
jgi:hypothetical protein